MAKRRPREKTSRQERRQAARNDAKAQQTVETTSPLTAATSYSRQDVLVLVALGLLVVVSYLPAMLWGGFVWDDNLYIKVDPVRDVSGLWQIWFSPSAIDGERHYWPLVYTTFWLEHKLWGFDPTGYHIVNVLLHLANTLLVWHLVRRLAVPGAWVVAAVFAVHPLHVESVAWVIERKDVLSGLFYLAAALGWMRFVEKPHPRRYALPLVLYAAGLLSKSIVVTLPVALLIWHWWKQGRVTSADLLRLVPFCVVGLVITIGDLSFARSIVPVSFDYSLAERALIAARALWFYTGKLLWPTSLAVIYPRWDIYVADPLAWGYLIAAVALAVVLWHFRSQLGRGPLAGALFFVVTLSPILGFVDYGYMKYAFVADRYQYLAGIGVMAVVIGAAAYGVGRLPSLWQRGVLGVAAVVLVVLGMLTWRQASIYRDEETFNRHIIALNPQARNAYRHLGNALYKQKRYEEALDAFRVAVAQRPNYAKVHVGLGSVLNKLERYKEAETHLHRAIELDPKAKHSHLRLGNALYEQGRYAEAVDAYRVAIEQRPDDATAHANLGMALNKLERYDQAETHLRRAIALDSKTKHGHRHLGNALYEQGRHAEAIDAYRVAIEQRPDDAVAHANLGAALNILGRNEEAETHLHRAIALDSKTKHGHRHLGNALYGQGRYAEAVDAYRVAIEQRPDDAAAHASLGATLNILGRNEEAETHLHRALALNPSHTEALYFLATLRAEQQRYDEMLELLQRLINIDPNDAEAHVSMGVAFFFLGRSDEALQHFDQALSLDPTLEDARTNREAVLEAMEENMEENVE